ncbi:MAG: aspartate aminotransferase family protein [Spirochaetales bacterium]|nr:aspartate aminotransferase family protein [Spirochaetales bacterium]
MNIQAKMFLELKDKELFRRAGNYALEYAETALDRNVFPDDKALKNLVSFEEDMPIGPLDAVSILDWLHKYGSPATVSQIGGRYFGFVDGGVIPAALAVKWLTDFWDQNTPMYVTSPVVARIESVVEKWLRQIFFLPDETVAGFVSGSSMAILCGLAAARFRILEKQGWDVNKKGLAGAPPFRVVLGRQAHGSVIKGLAILGIGSEQLEYADVDDQGRIIPETLPELDDRTILILQAGHVCTGSFDPFDKIMPIAEKAGVWVHIDGAFGLWAAGSNRFNNLTTGMSRADSWSADGHKTLNTPYDSGIILCKDREALISALHASGSYLLYGEERDGMLYTPEMSRRARAVEMWAALKFLGTRGLAELVEGLHERALQFAAEFNEQGFNVLNDVVFNQVLVSCKDDNLTERVLKLVQQSGECWCGNAEWDNKYVIRVSVCSWATTAADVSRSVKAFVDARRIVKDR